MKVLVTNLEHTPVICHKMDNRVELNVHTLSGLTLVNSCQATVYIAILSVPIAKER